MRFHNHTNQHDHTRAHAHGERRRGEHGKRRGGRHFGHEHGGPCLHQHGEGSRHEHGEHPRSSANSARPGGTHRRPTLEHGIVKAARRIRRSGLSPEQLHRRVAATVSHADYVTTMRTLRQIGLELRTER